MTEYLGLPLLNRTTDPIDWWKDPVVQFPHLTKLARKARKFLVLLLLKFLATPASSVYLERVVF